ncbi:MAG: hypothetical protein A2Y91_03550 [Chloroflexi bacterium RBG_13_54_8]|nr:MAG: hypothetical protein A2Y91_03550 [Chloroflexi bacterium RBG_13_54_8]
MDRKEVNKLYQRARNLVDSPGEYYPALAKAEAALSAWRLANPEKAAEEDAERAAWKAKEEARRREDFESSFIGRGLD